MKHTNPFGISLDRRGFLKAAGLGAGAAMVSRGLAPGSALAQQQEEHFFVFAYFGGAWDTLLCLDPRDPDDFTNARASETRIQLGWELLDPAFQTGITRFADSPITFGPAIGGMARHYKECCVIRGLAMDTLTHEVGRRYMLTGQMPAGLQPTGSSIATRIAAQQGDISPIPNLVSRVETYSKDLPAFASGLSVNGSGDLVLTLERLPGAPPQTVMERLNAYRSVAVPCDPSGLNSQGFLDRIREAGVKAETLISRGLQNYFNFSANTPEMTGIRERYDIPRGVGGPGQASGTPAEQAALAFQAIKHNVAQCVTISLATGLDTHDESWETDHPEQLKSGFDSLATLIDDLKANQLMSKTTIVVFSEFGRTALLNSRGGRDHSLTSSALLIGAGVPENVVIGASTDVGMNPLPIDPSTGAVLQSGGTALTPGLVLASVMQANGYDPSSLRLQGLPCLMA